jgi:hypothetical protein
VIALYSIKIDFIKKKKKKKKKKKSNKQLDYYPLEFSIFLNCFGPFVSLYALDKLFCTSS